jgi:hypothetical protein
MERDIGGYELRFAATIEPRRDGAGGVAAYNNSAPEGKRLNLHGRGRFADSPCLGSGRTPASM